MIKGGKNKKGYDHFLNYQQENLVRKCKNLFSEDRQWLTVIREAVTEFLCAVAVKEKGSYNDERDRELTIKV